MELLQRLVFDADLDKETIIEKSIMKSDSLWSLYPRLSNDFDECVELFSRLEKIKELSGVDAAGIPIKLVEITHSDIWFKLLPICLWIRSRKTSHRISVGVCGPPGAGKTVFSEILKSSLNFLFSNSCSTLAFDAYHFPNSFLDSNTIEHDGKHVPLRQLKGQPFTFDIPLFLNDLKKLRNKEKCFFPVYDRKLHDPVSNAVVVEPHHEYVIVEGMLLLYNEMGYDKIKEMLDVVVFVEEDMERCHKRLIERKVSGGRDREDSEKHYERVDKPNIIRVNNTKENANLRVLFEDGRITGCILQK